MRKIKTTLSNITFLLLILWAISGTATAAEETPTLLKDLDVTNGYMIQYDKATFEYTVELNEGECVPDIVAVPADDTCIVQIEGAEGEMLPNTENVVEVFVSDIQGNSATYILRIYTQALQSDRLGGLSFLSCLNGSLAPQYRESARRFYIVLPNDQEYAELDIRTWNENAAVTVIDNENLVAGKRQTAIIEITEADGTVYKYELYIYRQEVITSNINRSFLLTDIQINSGAIDISFNQNQGYYKIPVSASVTELDIKASSQNRANIVQIFGSKTMTESTDTIVLIVVSNPDDDTMEQSIYTLDFYYEQYTKTPKYTGFQITMVAIISLLVPVFIMIAIIAFNRYNGKHTPVPDEPAQSADSISSKETIENTQGYANGSQDQ